MSQGERQSTKPVQQTEVAVPANPLPAIGDDQWNKDISGILTSNTNNALAELGFNPNVLRALKDADNTITKLKAEKRMLETTNRDLSAHLALANNRIDFSKQDIHAMWKEVIFYREKHHILQRQHQEVLQAHSACATGPPEQPYIHLLQELEKLQDMYRHILGQNTTLKFEVQRLMQHCVNAGLIPPPQNYVVTPIPALHPPTVQPGAARRVSEPAVGHQQLQVPAQYGKKGAQLGLVARQFASLPSNPYPTHHSVAHNPAIVAGPIQAYNYHRTQLPQPQQPPAQLMPPPQPQGQPSVSQRQISAIRPRQTIDLTDSDDERAPKRPRMASDPGVYIQNSPGQAIHLQHQVYAQMPAPAPYQILQQRNLQSRAQAAHLDNMQTQLTQQHYSQRPGPTNPYQQAPPPISSHNGQYRANTRSNVPTPPTPGPLLMSAYGAATSERGATRIQDQPPNGQVRAIGQPRQVYTDPAYPANVASPAADVSTNHAETSTERSTGTPAGSMPATGPLDSLPVSPRAMSNGHMHGGESPLPSLTEEQTGQMRWEVADSMFTEPREGDGTQARTCLLCDHRRELGILFVSPQPLLKPATEEMYSHLQAHHPESLEIGERDWKMELFGMGPFRNQQQ